MLPLSFRTAGILALAAGLLGPSASGLPAAGQPTRGQVRVTTPFDALLIQKNRDKPLFVVTSDGNTFTDARLVRDDNSPLVFRYELECRDGFTDPFSGDVHSDGRLKDVFLETEGWGAELPSANASWTYAADLLIDVMNNESVKGDFNVVAKGPDAVNVRSRLNSLKKGVIAACNGALDAKMRQGFPRKTALTQIGMIDPIPSVGPEMLPATLRATCEHEIFTPKEFEDGVASHRTKTDTLVMPGLQLRMPVLCESPFDAPRPATDSLTQGFAVQEIELAPEQDIYRGTCPLTVRLSGHAKLTGSGQFRYRYRTGSGALGAPVTVQVKDGRKPVPLSVSIEVGKSPSGRGFTTPKPGGDDGLTLTVPLPDPDPAGPTLAGAPKPKPPVQGATDIAAPKAPGQITDWVRLEVLSPTGGVRASEEVFYKAICEQSVVAGGGRVTTPPRAPDRQPSRTTPPPRGAGSAAPRRVNPDAPRTAGQLFQFQLDLIAEGVEESASRGLRTGPARLTIDARGPQLRGTLTQGRTVVRNLPLVLQGCQRSALEKLSSGRGRLLSRGGRAEIEIRGDNGCVLVGRL